MTAALRKWGPWAALVVIAAVVLTLGLRSSSPPSLNARVQSIASQVRCPVCNGETVAQSQVAPSVEIRNQIRSDLIAGRTRSQILAGLVQAYGPGILEKPQARGIGLVVWIAPVVAIIFAAGALVLVLRRWKMGSRSADETAFTADGSEEAGATLSDRTVTAVAEGPAETSVRSASPVGIERAPTGRVSLVVAPAVAVDGAEAPVAVGDAGDGTAPALGADPALEPSGRPSPGSGAGPTDPSGPSAGSDPSGGEGTEPAGSLPAPASRRSGHKGRAKGRSDRPAWSRRKRQVVGGVGAGIVSAGIAWAVVAAFTHRLPGESVTGLALPAQSIASDLQAASKYASNNDALNAVKEYEKVLKVEPDQVEALTGMGFILAQTGQPSLLKQGLGQLASAEKIDPSYAPAHLYRGLVLLGEGNYGASVPELQWYLDHHPDPQLTAQVKKALVSAQAGQAAASRAAHPSSPSTSAGK